MTDTPEYIRERPRPVRRSVVFVLSLIVFGAIVGVWFSTKDVIPEANQPAETNPSPLNAVRGIFSNVFNSSSFQVDSISTASTGIQTDVNASNTPETPLNMDISSSTNF